ncbi:Actin-like protein arp5 [Ceratocystis lukuohia]|uniref:Actin-like protein arp5 n=2 Tax=Ceratocystis TaxID=5157 RepID=A0ABR4MPJ2_9PEZI
MAPTAVDSSAMDVDLDPRKLPPQRTYPPAKIYPVREAKFEQAIPVQQDGREKALSLPSGSAAIVIDNGSSAVRAGWSFDERPRFSIPPIFCKYRDRKAGKTFTFAGSDCYADNSARSHIKNVFETGTNIVSSWDAMEHVLDYIFIKLGMNEVDGTIDVPIVMTEAVANLAYSRKTMSELVFECYGAPSLAYGIDSLFSFKYNQGSTGLVVSSSYTSTHVIPVFESKAILSQATRLNWGSYQASEYLLKLLKLKYPTFNGKQTVSQAEHMIRDFGYVSTDYDNELSHYLDWTGLEDRDIVVQYPYVEEVVVQKSEEELARIAERKREGGRRLQEQAAKMRLEKLMQKERQLEHYKQVQTRLQETNKKDTKRLLDDNELKDETHLERVIRDLDKAVRKARTKDVGGADEEEQGPPVFDLINIPDDELDESDIKAKKLQKLAKANYEARQRAKAEKLAEKERIAEEKRLDDERRDTDTEAWLADRRDALTATLQKIKEKERLKADMGNRKSLASQIRMKSIANLASDTPTKKRRRGGDDDDFGANDDDWGVYRDIADQSDEEEEDLMGKLNSLEQELLRFDDDFTYEDTFAAKSDWSKSLIHAFERGPRPFDSDSVAEANQIHLNVERIRVPEVVFQPSIAGLDQAGLVQIAGDILNQRMSGHAGRTAMLQDVFCTGGNTMFRGFSQRLEDGLRMLLEAGAPLRVRSARNPLEDAWKGAAQWAGSDAWRTATITRTEYEEKGSDYIKEHDMGNSYVPL